MYKRKARVLFFCAGCADYCLVAVEFANRRGKDWLEARAVGVGPAGQDPRVPATLREIGIDTTGGELLAPTDTRLAWADLVVTIGDEVDAHRLALPAHVQKRHWPFATLVGGDADDIARTVRAACDDIRARVDGIVGGLRLMARSDTGDA